jgi:hypothetical protein
MKTFRDIFNQTLETNSSKNLKFYLLYNPEYHFKEFLEFKVMVIQDYQISYARDFDVEEYIRYISISFPDVFERIYIEDDDCLDKTMIEVESTEGFKYLLFSNKEECDVFFQKGFFKF